MTTTSPFWLLALAAAGLLLLGSGSQAESRASGVRPIARVASGTGYRPPPVVRDHRNSAAVVPAAPLPSPLTTPHRRDAEPHPPGPPIIPNRNA